MKISVCVQTFCEYRGSEPLFLPTSSSHQRITHSRGSETPSVLSMPLSKTRQLHHEIGRSYRSWVNDAPTSYTEDGFFVDSFPIAITSRCGQNQRFSHVAKGNDYEKEKLSWNKLRDFSQIKYLSLAVASQLS